MSVTIGWPARHDLALARGADVDDAVLRRADFRVAQADVGLLLLRGRRGQLLLAGGQLAAPHRHLLGVRLRERDRRARGVHLLAERLHARLRRVVRRPRGIELLLRRDARLQEILHALERQARVLEIGGRRGLLRFRRSERRLGLANLALRLLLLEAQRRLALLDLRRRALGRVRVVRAVGPQLVGHDEGQDLILRDDVAFLHAQLADLAADLRADDDVVGRDEAGEGQRGRAGPEDEVDAGADDEHGSEEDGKTLAHGVGGRRGVRRPISNT